jgi:hypothetical protein
VNRLVVPVVFATALLGAPGADAGQPSPQTTVCGKSLRVPTKRACLRLDGRGQSAQIIVASLADPFEKRSRPRPAPFYSVTVRFPDPHRQRQWSFLYVPARGLVRNMASIGIIGPDSLMPYWRDAPLLVTVAFETLSKRLHPFPAPRRWSDVKR